MQKHGFRLDITGEKRVVYPERKPIWYRPYGANLKLLESYDKHVEGAQQSKRAGHLARHAFVQFPTDIEMSAEVEKMLIREAAAFIDKTHGGRAVFEARLDRDERGRHGVDVFFAPRYSKKTAKGEQDWISLTKFGKALARKWYGQRQLEIKNPKTEKWEKQVDEDGEPIMVWNDSKYWQGKALQDEWFEHLRDQVGLDFVVRGKPKLGREADRVEPEEYGVMQDRATRVRLQEESEELRASIEDINRQISEQTAKRQKNERYLEGQQAKLSESNTKVEQSQAILATIERRIGDYSRRVETAKAELDRLEALKEAAQSAYEADLMRGREEGREEGINALRDAREAAQALAGGEITLTHLKPLAAEIRAASIEAVKTNRFESDNMHRRTSYTKLESDEWRTALQEYRRQLAPHAWEDLTASIKRAHEVGESALKELSETKTGYLVDRVLAVVRCLADYWNGIAQAFLENFGDRVPNRTIVKGIIDSTVRSPASEYGYLQPLVKEAQQEVQVLNLAEKLAAQPNRSGP